MSKGKRNINLFRQAGAAILAGDIVSVYGLYRFVSKKVIADLVGLSPVYFSNSRSERLDDFTIGELMLLADSLNIPFLDVADLFHKSILNDHEKFEIDII